MMFTPDFILQLIVGVGSAIGVYAGIKSDLAVTREKATTANRRADDAHTRIDDLFKANK